MTTAGDSQVLRGLYVKRTPGLTLSCWRISWVLGARSRPAAQLRQRRSRLPGLTGRRATGLGPATTAVLAWPTHPNRAGLTELVESTSNRGAARQSRLPARPQPAHDDHPAATINLRERQPGVDGRLDILRPIEGRCRAGLDRQAGRSPRPEPVIRSERVDEPAHQKVLEGSPRAVSDWGSGVRSRGERRPHRSTALGENDMTATYTFDVFPRSTATAPTSATGAATGASKAPSYSTAASPCTTRSSGWSSGPTRTRRTRRCWPRASRSPS